MTVTKNKETDERNLETPSSDGSSNVDPALVVPPDGGWGWVVVAASFLCNLIGDGIIFSAGLLLPPLTKEFQASGSEAALVNSLLSGFYLMAGPFVSALANRWGFRIVTAMGSAITCIALVASYFATSIIILYITYGVIGGIGFCMMYLPSVLVVGFYFERWRALATGLAVCGSGVGTFLIAPFTSYLVQTHGWRWTLLAHAGLVVLCGLAGIAFRPLRPMRIQLEPKDSDRPQSAPLTQEERADRLRELLQKRTKTELEDLKGAHTWVGVASAVRYPTAAELFKCGPRRASLRPHRLPTTTEDDEVESGAEPLLLTPRSRIYEGVARPLYRDDIFFSGSLARLEQYRSHTSLGYHMSVTRVPSPGDSKDEGGGAVRRALATLLDVSLLKSPTFLLLAFGGFLTMLGFFVPYAYVTERAVSRNMSTESAKWLVSSVGLANVVGRVACGLVSSAPSVSPLHINNAALLAGGAAIGLSNLSYEPAVQFTACVVFGLAVACFASLRTILAVQYVGLERLTNCFGLLLLFQGAGAVMGAPIAGALKDATGDYDTAFWVAGAFLVLSALISVPLDLVAKCEQAPNAKKSSKQPA